MDDTYDIFEEDSNEWDIDKAKFLKKIADKNGALVWLHNKSASNYTIIQKVWTIIVAVCIIIFGAGGITGIAGVDNVGMVLGFQIVIIVAGGVSIVQTIIGLDGMADNHNDAAIRNSEIFLFILKELGEKNVLLRIRGDRFVHMMLEKDTFVKSQEPPIPARIVRKYYKKFGNHAVPYDHLFGNDELLKIDDSLLRDRKHEVSIVRQLAQTTRNVAEMESVDTEESLNTKLKEHDKKALDRKGIKFKRKVPALSSHEMSVLAKYMNE
jgi:hypothetical protein